MVDTAMVVVDEGVDVVVSAGAVPASRKTPGARAGPRVSDDDEDEAEEREVDKGWDRVVETAELVVVGNGVELVVEVCSVVELAGGGAWLVVGC